MGAVAAPAGGNCPPDIVAAGAHRVEVRAYGVALEWVAVYDMAGRCVSAVHPEASEWMVDLSGCAPGVYIVKAATASASTVGRIAVR